MFVNYNLTDIENNKVDLIQKNKSDLEIIMKCFEIEGFELSNWNLFEIAKSKDKNVYGFININNDYFYMKIGENSKATPHYFKNHGLGEYSEFQAHSIKDAIEKFEKSYTG